MPTRTPSSRAGRSRSPNATPSFSGGTSQNGCTRFSHRLTGNHPIVGEPRQLISFASHLLIKWRQKYVTERRRNHTPLRSAALTGKELPFAVASRLEHRLDETKHSAIRYPLGYQREKLLVIH